jgi:GNAT superfamily N-acetyltransferase
MGIATRNRNSIATSLWKGEKLVAHMNIDIAPHGLNHVVAEFGGYTNKNYRGKGIGTWYRALITKALLNSGVNKITHGGANMENLVAKELAKKEGISLLNAQKRINLIPLSTRIVRKLGYTPLKNKNGRNTASSVMKITNNMTNLNNILKRLGEASPKRNRS